MSQIFPMTRFLKTVLMLDAVASGGMGILMAAGKSLLPEFLGLPSALLFEAGLFLIAYALFVAYIGTRPYVILPAVKLIIGGNLVWVVASLTLSASGLLPLTMLGHVFVVGQALAVLAFASLQWLGLNRAEPA